MLKIVGLSSKLIFGVALVLISACSQGGWQTSYSDIIKPEISKGWRVTQVDVSVPETLSVSEQNSFAPNADIVWREEPLGNRYEQVDKIITEAAELGSRVLVGQKPVRLAIEVTEFHALTEKTRFTLQHSGVHNISFTAQVFDAKSGEPLTGMDPIRADLIGLSGDEAIAAIGQGQTQRVRIIEHVSMVIAGWLGNGPDLRGSFARNGR